MICLHFPPWLPNILLCEATPVLIFLLLPSLPYAHVFHGSSLLFPFSLTQFLPWSLLGLQLAPQKNDLLCQASQSVTAKTHLLCRYFTQSFFRLLYCHPYDGYPRFRIFSLLRLHSCINLSPTASGQTISHLCPASNTASSSTKLQNELPYPPHIHLWFLLLPSGDLCLRFTLGPWALNCSNWLT